MTGDLTAEERAELASLEKAATPRPWKASDDSPDDVVVWAPGEPDPSDFITNVGSSRVSMVGVCFDGDEHNAAFIAAARNALPRLLAQVERLEADHAVMYVALVVAAAVTAVVEGPIPTKEELDCAWETIDAALRGIGAPAMLAQVERLEAECRRREQAESEALALVMSHEGHIAKLEAENAALQADKDPPPSQLNQHGS